MQAGLARAHRRFYLAASADTSPSNLNAPVGVQVVLGTNVTAWPNGWQPGWEAKGYTKWEFTISATGTVTTPSITFYGTNDPDTARGTTGNANAWKKLAAPSEQAGTGTVQNPITATDGSQYFEFTSGPLEAIRITTNAFTGGGTVIVDMMATP